MAQVIILSLAFGKCSNNSRRNALVHHPNPFVKHTSQPLSIICSVLRFRSMQFVWYQMAYKLRNMKYPCTNHDRKNIAKMRDQNIQKNIAPALPVIATLAKTKPLIDCPCVLLHIKIPLYHQEPKNWTSTLVSTKTFHLRSQLRLLAWDEWYG